MITKTYIAADPGPSSGAFAFIHINIDGSETYHTMQFAKHTLEDIDTYIKACKNMSDGGCFAYYEVVHTFMKQGISSSGKLMRNLGHIEGLLIANGIPNKGVTPQYWMKEYEMKREKAETKTAWKKRLRALLLILLPNFKSCVNDSDAMLIANLCRNEQH